MQSPLDDQELHISGLCASVRDIIDTYLSVHTRPEVAHNDGLRLEVQTLCTYLELIEKVRLAKAHKPDVERTHLRDIDRLLERCAETFTTLKQTLQEYTAQGEAGSQTISLENPNETTFATSRIQISFYKRTLELSLMSINL